MDGTNLYRYVSNDPINYIDPDGRFAWGPVLIVAAVGAVAVITIGAIYTNQQGAQQPGAFASIPGTNIRAYNPNYNDLSPEGKRIIDRHENVHTKQPFPLFKKLSEPELEIPAYEEQIRAANEELANPNISPKGREDAEKLKAEAEINLEILRCGNKL